jgi:hypothetical protein
MPNYIQYSTQIPSGSLKKGNAALGITNEVTGPTSTTGWYSGINPQSGSYVVYEVAASGDPDIYCPLNNTELLNLVKSKGAIGSNTGSVAAALAWIATQNNLLAVNEVYPNIITNSDVLNLDAQFVGSYPTTGSTWYDVSGYNNNSTLTNGPTFNSLGVISFDNVDDYVQISSSLDLNALAATRNMTICFMAKKLFYSTGGNNTGDSMVLIGANNGYNSGFRITEINNGTPGTPFTGSPHYNFGAPALGNGFAALSPRAQNTNTFSYVCFAQSGSSITSFINGKFATGTLPNAYTPGANNGAIGRDVGAGVGWFGGYIGNFQIYNRSLSQAEILQNYYQAPIVTDGLVLALDAGNLASYESGSTSTYSMTGSVSGSLINGVNYNSGNNGSWVFDGVDDNIDFGDVTTTEFGTGDFTLSAWIYIPTDVIENTGFFKGIIVKKGASAAQAGYAMYYNTGQQKFLWSTANGSSAAERFSTNTWGSLKGTWANVVMVRQNGATNNGHFYINGVYESIASSATVLDVNGDFNLRLGSGNLFGNYFFQGNIADAKIYNRALSATEASQNFNAQKTRFGL